MDFDFKKTYETFSNIELLKISLQPGAFRDDAIDIANGILSKREVTEYEREQAELYVRQIAAQKHFNDYTRKELQATIKENVQEFIDPRQNTSGKIKPVLWVRLLVLVSVIQYLFDLPDEVRNLNYTFHEFGLFDSFSIIQLAIIIYTPVFCYLMLMKKKWGWRLFVFNAIFILLITPIGLIDVLTMTWEYSFISPSEINFGTYLFNFCLYGFVLFFLLNPIITKHFSIDAKTKKATIIYSLLLSVIIMSGTALLNR